MSDTQLDAQWPTKPDPLAVREIVRMGEAQIQDLLAAALAADSRAITQANMLAAVAAGLVVASTAIDAMAIHDRASVIALAISSAGFLVAAMISMTAAKPINFFARGWAPAKLIPFSDELLIIEKWTAEDIQMKIEANRIALDRGGQLTSRAHYIALGAIIIPLTIVVATHLCR